MCARSLQVGPDDGVPRVDLQRAPPEPHRLRALHLLVVDVPQAEVHVVAQVSRVLRDALRDDEGHIELVAKRLGLTARSLQRRLKDEGTSFNAVREDVRRQLSRRYLDEGLSIAEISFLLGFSEPITLEAGPTRI